MRGGMKKGMQWSPVSLESNSVSARAMLVGAKIEYLLILLCFVINVQSSNIRALELVDGKSFLKAQREPQTENSPISICLRVFPYRIKDNVIPLISIRLEALDNENGFDPDTNRFLEIWMINNGGRMKNGDQPFRIQTVHYNFKNNGDMGAELERYPYQWYHFCFAFQKTGPGVGEQVYFANGEMIFHGQNMSITDEFPWLKGNKIKVGHSVSKLATTGGSVFGLLADVQIFNRMLSEEEGAGYTNCNQKLTGDIADWETEEDWEVVGDVKVVEVAGETICTSPLHDFGHDNFMLEHVMIIPALLTYQENADKFVEHDLKMFKAVQPLSYKNKPNPRCAKRLFLGADDIEEENYWVVKETNQPVKNYLQYFQPGQPNGARKQNVAGFHFGSSGKPEQGLAQFDDGGAGENQCFMCKFITPPRLRMRGLCKKAKMDTFYSLLYDSENNLPYFKGYDKTIIRLEEDLDTKGGTKYWQILEVEGNETKILGNTEMIPVGSSLASGLKSWTFQNPVCSGKEEMVLEFSTCNDDQFTCKSDGECMDMETRCDKFPNCEDFSDEDDCKIVVLDDNYVADFAPLEKLNKTAYKRTEVFVTVDILSLLEISENEEVLEAKFELTLKWRDFRIKFHNLKEENSMNTLTKTEKSIIWVPKVVFVNTKDNEVSKSDDSVFTEIEKQENATFNSFEENENIHLFNGRKNYVVMKRTYSVKWICSFNMMWYPFDTQSCTMEFRPEGNSNANIKLVVENLIYQGPKDLTQYFIKSTRMTFRKKEERIIVIVTLGRRLIGTILTVFLPTNVMVIISQATNYFKPFFFEAVITVNLTIILVICTMFLAISQSLPTTSYMKMIDLWFMLVLMVPFIFVLLHTYMDMLRNYEHRKDQKGKDKTKNAKKDAKNVTILNVTPVNTVEPQMNADLVSTDEQTQNAALKKHYEDIEANGKNLKVASTVKVARVYIPIAIYSSMGLYWLAGMNKYFE